MTARPSMLAPHVSSWRTRGFTLMELLVVIGIIALLISLLIPVLSMVNRQGQRTRTAALISTISTALEQYKSDFGDYPRFSLDDPSFPNPLNSADDRGARLLARAMFGPAPANDTVTDDTAGNEINLDYAKTAFQDGHGDAGNPFGFKENRQIVTRDEDGDGTPESAAYYAGKVFQYLDPERFDLRTSTGDWQTAGYKYGPDVVMLDPAELKPILYYPGLAKQPDISKFADRLDDPNETVGLFVDTFNQVQRQQSLYNSSDNLILDEPNPDDLTDPPNDPAHARDKLRVLLGDLDKDGRILGDTNNDGTVDPATESAEQSATKGPYLLIAVGVDGSYVRAPIANFQPAASAAAP